MPFTPPRTVSFRAFSDAYVVCTGCPMPYTRVRNTDAAKADHAKWHSTNGVDVAMPVSHTPWLCFDLDIDAMFTNQRRRIGPHYWPPVVRSLDNAPWRNDYVARVMLNPQHEYGVRFGGLWRDRPVPWPEPRPFSITDPQDKASVTWRLDNAKWDVRKMVESGFDHCPVNIMSLPGGADFNQPLNVRALMRAAEVIEPRFKVMLMLDQVWSGNNQAQVATFVAELSAHKSAYRLPDGRLLLSTFLAESAGDRTPGGVVAWWKEFLRVAEVNHGVKIAFMPTFLDERPFRELLKGWCYGVGIWGYAAAGWNDPAAVGDHTQPARAAWAKANGLEWYQPIRVQDVRPREGRFWESEGSLNLLRTFDIYSRTGATFGEFNTWGDYYEGAYILPGSIDGHGWADLQAYFNAAIRFGASPRIVRDVAYLLHRPMLTSTQPRLGYELRYQLDSPGTVHQAKDIVEVTTFLTAPDNVSVQIAGRTHTYDAPAGHHRKVLASVVSPPPVVTTGRGQRVTSKLPIVDAAPVQDFRYYCFGSRERAA